MLLAPSPSPSPSMSPKTSPRHHGALKSDARHHEQQLSPSSSTLNSSKAIIDEIEQSFGAACSLQTTPRRDTKVKQRRHSSVTEDEANLVRVNSDKLRHMNRAMSTDSVDSTSSTLDTLDIKTSALGQVDVTLNYDLGTNMLSVTFNQLIDLHIASNKLSPKQVWIVGFLQPHPKPLWRTQLHPVGNSAIALNETHFQCVLPQQLKKVALLCQVYIRDAPNELRRKTEERDEKMMNSPRKVSRDSTLIGQCRVRLRDVDFFNSQTQNLNMTLLAHVRKHSIDDSNGQVLFSLAYDPHKERLSVIIGLLRDVHVSSSTSSPSTSTSTSTTDESKKVDDGVQIRAYLVGSGRAKKKKTSVHLLESDGIANINESVQFSLSKNQLNKSSLRLSIAHRSLTSPSTTIGHVTVGARHSDASFGHWQKMQNTPNGELIPMWHDIMRVE